MANPTVFDQTAIDVATATEQYASYGTSSKQDALQRCAAVLDNAVNVQIRAVLSVASLDHLPDLPKMVVSTITALLNTATKLSIRPIAYPSALMCLSTAHKLVMLLDEVEVPKNIAETRSEWVKVIKELGKTNTKWGKITVPGSLVRLASTRLELSVVSIPDPKVG